MLRSLAFQLACVIPALAAEFAAMDPKTLSEGLKGSTEDAFEAFLAGPLTRVSSQLPPNVVILIDALDECDGATSLDNPILRLLRDQLSKLPKQV